MARYWSLHFADAVTLGGPPDHVGPTTVASADGSETELDVVVAAGAEAPSERTVLAIGEAKAGERITERHLRRLEAARTRLSAVVQRKQSCCSSELTSHQGSSRMRHSARTWSWSTSSVCTLVPDRRQFLCIHLFRCEPPAAP
jgi:hypothetical protein